MSLRFSSTGSSSSFVQGKTISWWAENFEKNQLLRLFCQDSISQLSMVLGLNFSNEVSVDNFLLSQKIARISCWLTEKGTELLPHWLKISVGLCVSFYKVVSQFFESDKKYPPTARVFSSNLPLIEEPINVFDSNCFLNCFCWKSGVILLWTGCLGEVSLMFALEFFLGWVVWLLAKNVKILWHRNQLVATAHVERIFLNQVFFSHFNCHARMEEKHLLNINTQLA